MCVCVIDQLTLPGRKSFLMATRRRLILNALLHFSWRRVETFSVTRYLGLDKSAGRRISSGAVVNEE